MDKIRLNINGKEYEIEILKDNTDKIKVRVNDKDFIFEKEKKEQISVAKTSLPKRSFSKKEITAPITGEISDIFIKKGDYIKKNKKIILLSAMKMENEIITEFEGRVKKVLVDKNQKVNKGDILAILE